MDDAHTRIIAEIEDLHAFFVAWFRGELPADGQSFDRLERALAEDFEMITPRGERIPRGPLVASLKAAHGSMETRFEIEVRNVGEPRSAGTNAYVVGYEEWQWRGEEQTARLSTAWLERRGDAWAWRHVHETWLPGLGPSSPQRLQS